MTDHERLCELLRQCRASIDIAAHYHGVEKDIDAMLTRLRSDGPDGLRVVPVEPTALTILTVANEYFGGHADGAKRCYRAMLRAGGERADL